MNVTIQGNIAFVRGGVVDQFSIQPQLPLGLALDTATGRITGTPLLVTPRKVYNITASNSGGATSTNLVLSVINGELLSLHFHFHFHFHFH